MLSHPQRDDCKIRNYTKTEQQNKTKHNEYEP